MNTSELRPIDARVMKPGDPVVHVDGSPGKFIAYVPEATESNRAVVFLDGRISVYSYTFDGRSLVGESLRVFLPPDPDPVDPSPGNTRGLRKSQIPPGYRIAAHSEGPNRRAKYWSPASNCAVDRARPMDVYCPLDTYLVPIAPIRMVPLSVEDFVGKPWPLVRVGESMRLMYKLNQQGVEVLSLGLVSFSSLRRLYPISWDHGVTWVKAEKEEQV